MRKEIELSANLILEAKIKINWQINHMHIKIYFEIKTLKIEAE